MMHVVTPMVDRVSFHSCSIQRLQRDLDRRDLFGLYELTAGAHHVV